MEPEKKSNGALIGSIIIIIILVLGGIYIWQSKNPLEEQLPVENVSTSDTDELNTLEKDLEGVDTNIDANVINSVE
mgnify:CR=1 FL=1